MAKYNELVGEYKNQIDKIKALQVKRAELDRKIGNADEQEAYDLLEEINDVSQELDCEFADLDYEIQAEYHAVPFDKPRNEGISGFWRESGLR